MVFDPNPARVGDLPDMPRSDPTAAPQKVAIADLPAVLQQNLAKAAASPVELLLNPEELGRMRFEMHQQGDHLRIVLTVERSDTQDLLRRHADQLLAEFKGAGFSGASLSFGHWGQGQTPAKPHPDPMPDSNPEDPAPPPTHPALPVAAALAAQSLGQGLNLRL